MIPKDCKRLAEVDFPIAVVSKHAAKEKSIRYGHPSTLHLWWARRPLASCRAMLLALLLPDPCDEHCPEDFRTKARVLLPPIQREVGPTDHDLRQVLLKFIGDFANWDLSANPTYLNVARGLVKAAHGDEPPLVVDPFAGGGSIPLEALRLGCDAFASDLNPVACLILKVMLEDIPRHGPELAKELRRVGAEIKAAAEKKLAEFYPTDPDGARPIAYLWARTVWCESPNCGAEIPLVRSLWLSTKHGARRALRYKNVRSSGRTPQVEFDIFEPAGDADVAGGTVKSARATCVCCSAVLAPERVRSQLSAQHGGADTIFGKDGDRIDGARLLAVVVARSGEQGRSYRLPSDRDYLAVRSATRKLASLATTRPPGDLTTLPNEPVNPIRPSPNARGLSAVTRYGMETFGDLFTSRQKLSLLTLAECIARIDTATDAARQIAALALSRFTDISNALCRWENTKTQVRNTFTRQALSMKWDFAEPHLFGQHAGDYLVTLETMVRVIDSLASQTNTGQVQLADACASPLPDAITDVWFTDPPYYDAIPYADLSDFFFVWLKRALPSHPLLRDPFDRENPLTPKQQECVWNQSYRVNGRVKDGAFFEQQMARAASEGLRVLHADGIGCVVFAHKSTEGWEALIGGLLTSGWVVRASWPVATELKNRTNARDAASLMGSVHLVCRPRTEDKIGDWGEVYRELPKRVSDWMEHLQSEGVRGADLVFACIGPALEIYSRYAKVVDAEEREIPLGGDPEATEPHKRGYLAYVWEAVGRAALEQVLGTAEASARNGAAGALEEDARLTALFLWTLQSTDANGENPQPAPLPGHEGEQENDDEDAGETPAPPKGKKGFSLIYDVARRFAQPLGIHLDQWEDRIIQTDKGVVRLLPVAERAKQLFGEDGAEAVADQLERNPTAAPQLTLFPDARDGGAPAIKGRGRKPRGKNTAGVSDTALQTRRDLPAAAQRQAGATTLDRVHAAMLLQAGGRANALRALLTAEQDRSPDFLRLANALSALYPKDSEEKRLLDAMLLAVPR